MFMYVHYLRRYLRGLCRCVWFLFYLYVSSTSLDTVSFTNTFSPHFYFMIFFFYLLCVWMDVWPFIPHLLVCLSGYYIAVNKYKNAELRTRNVKIKRMSTEQNKSFKCQKSLGKIIFCGREVSNIKQLMYIPKQQKLVWQMCNSICDDDHWQKKARSPML